MRVAGLLLRGKWVGSVLQMSRRRKGRRQAKVGAGSWLGKALIAAAILAVVVVGVGYASLRMYLHSEGFRKFLSAQVSSSMDVEGDFQAFRWDGLAVETDNFGGEGNGFVRSIQADRIDTEVGFGGLTEGVWELRRARVGRVEVELDLQNADEEEGETRVGERAQRRAIRKAEKSWVPSEVAVETVDIGSLTVRARTADGMAVAEGLSVQAVPAGGDGAYEAEIFGGRVTLPHDDAPEVRIRKIEGTYRDGSLFVTRAEADLWENGKLSGSGEWSQEEDYVAFEGRLDDVDFHEVFRENWAQRMTGDISTTFVVDSRRKALDLSGLLTVRNGTVTALPMLDALAAYADTRRFRVLQLNEARTEWRYADGDVHLTDFVMGSDGLIRLEGALTIRDEELDGRFRLGLVPGTLANIPGAETAVFRPGSHGLLWTDLRITGTVDDPKEDLTERLIEAAGARMLANLPRTGGKILQLSEGVIDKTSEKVLEEGRKLLDDPDKVIREADHVIRGAGGVLRGLLGE